MEDIIDHLLVRFGCAMLAIVPGRVSTETDARFSFDVQGSIRKAQRLVKLYEERGIGRERVLIKIASTWEGIMAAEQTADGRDQVQYDTALLASAGRASCGSEGATHFAIRFRRAPRGSYNIRGRVREMLRRNFGQYPQVLSGPDLIAKIRTQSDSVCDLTSVYDLTAIDSSKRP